MARRTCALLLCSLLAALAFGSRAGAEERDVPLVHPGPHWVLDISGRWNITLTHPDAPGPIPCTAVLLQATDFTVAGPIDCTGLGTDSLSGGIVPLYQELGLGGELMSIHATVAVDGTAMTMSGTWAPSFIAIPGELTGERKVMPPGDADCDGDANAIDALLALQLHAGLLDNLPCLREADVNGDGHLDSIDALMMLQHIVDPLLTWPE